MRRRTDANRQAQYRSLYGRVSPLGFGGCIQYVIANELVDFRLRLLEKAVEMRDRGQMVRAQELVDVANWLKAQIEAIEEQGPAPAI